MEESVINNEISKSWFAVLNNPAKHGYDGTPQEVCERLRSEWLKDTPTRSGAWAYCVSSEGLNHVHMVLEDSKALRFTAVKKNYANGMHFEATKGNRKQAEAYINKDPPFDEKGEKIAFICRAGEIKGAQGHRSDLAIISDLIDEGLNPDEIMSQDFSFRKYQRMIKDAFFAKRKKETPIKREVIVHYIVGESGAGKSYTYVSLCEKSNENSIYFLSDYEVGGFDAYIGEPILFMDEYKGQYRFSQLLSLLDCYKSQIHARYSNVVALWRTVFITSVYPPEELYKKMVEEDARGIDKQQQLMRRITDITYCFVDELGEYKRFTLPMHQYKSYEDLKKKSVQAVTPTQIRLDDFEEIPDDGTPLPF